MCIPRCGPLWVGAALLTLATPVVLQGAPPADARAVAHFEKRIRPLLLDRCLKCHGHEKTRGGLRLDSGTGVARGGDSGPAVVPGKPDDSLLIRAVRRTGDLKMPPDKELSRQEIADLVAWVKA